MYPGDTIFTRLLPAIQRTISFRSFNLESDLDLVHRWVNMDYTQKFWRLAYSKEQLYDLYYAIQRNSNGHSYLGLLDGQPICQWDLYRVLADEINKHIPGASPHDCGFHLLMAPNENPIPGLSTAIVDAWIDYYFSFPDARVMYAEPDILNKRSNRILQRTGFQFHSEIQMSYKTANLYSITKEHFMSRSIYSQQEQMQATGFPPAFFKPESDFSEPLFSTTNKNLEATITFRSLILGDDLSTLHYWVTQPYTEKYWQLNVSESELRSIYQNILDNPLSHSFIATIDGKMVCQVDLYHVGQEEIKDHITEQSSGHCGLHILMLPPRESRKGLTEAMLQAFTEYFFSFLEAEVLYGEPDIANQWGNIAAKRAGFQLQKTITLSYKTANLYAITKQQFHATHPIL